MEFMECGDLQSYLAQFDRKGIQPSSLALQLSSNVLEGLSFLHSHNIIHRDLKPANILLSNIHGSLIAKIAGTFFSVFKRPHYIHDQDFGIATIYDGSDSMGMVGTPRCMFILSLVSSRNFLYYTQIWRQRLANSCLTITRRISSALQ